MCAPWRARSIQISKARFKTQMLTHSMRQERPACPTLALASERACISLRFGHTYVIAPREPRHMQVACELEADLPQRAQQLMTDSRLSELTAALADTPHDVAQIVLSLRKHDMQRTGTRGRCWLHELPRTLMQPAICAEAAVRGTVKMSVDLYVNGGHHDAMGDNAVNLARAAALASMPAVTNLHVFVPGCHSILASGIRKTDASLCAQACCALPQQLAQRLAAATQLTSFEILALDCKRVAAPIISAVGRACTSQLRSLRVSSDALNDEGMKQIAAPLAGLTSLTQLRISGQKFGSPGADALAGALRQLTALQDLQIGHAKMASAKATTKLAPALACLSHLTALALCFAGKLQPALCRAYAPKISALRALRHLNLSGCGLCGAGAAELGKHMAALTDLEMLVVSGNKMAGWPGLDAVCAALPRLRSFRADKCDLGHHADEGTAHILFDSLAHASRLQVLSLASEWRGKHCLKGHDLLALAKVLPRLTALTYLNLEAAAGEETAGSAISSSLRCLTNLQVRRAPAHLPL